MSEHQTIQSSLSTRQVPAPCLGGHRGAARLRGAGALRGSGGLIGAGGSEGLEGSEAPEGPEGSEILGDSEGLEGSEGLEASEGLGGSDRLESRVRDQEAVHGGVQGQLPLGAKARRPCWPLGQAPILGRHLPQQHAVRHALLPGCRHHFPMCPHVRSPAAPPPSPSGP
jgi:hypothetical protein